MKKFIYSLFALMLSSHLYAEINTSNTNQRRIDQRLNDQRIQTESQVNYSQQTANNVSTQAVISSNQISMKKDELAQRPDLIVRALILAVMQGNGSTVDFLLPFYQNVPAEMKDPLLTKWANAISARNQRNHSQAIRHYRQLLADKTDIPMARFQLAVTLFENNELEASEDQFQKLRSENLSEDSRATIDQYLDAIRQRDRWAFGGGFTFLNDRNINNAPKKETTVKGWKSNSTPESGQGIGFNADLGKKWSWGNGFYNEFRLALNGKYYWNNKKYNELSTRANFGLGYQNAKWNISLLPFMEQMLYAGGSNQSQSIKRFSKTSGATLENVYWLSPKWQLSQTYEYGEQRYTRRKHLNGNYHFLSAGVTFLANAKQYWFANLNYNRTSTRDRDDSFIRKGVSLGWGQEWGQGLSTRLSVSYARKNYKAPMPIFGITQRNKEIGVQASIWHRAIHYKGITPRLTYSYNKVNSNHAFYRYDKQKIFIDLSKRF